MPKVAYTEEEKKKIIERREDGVLLSVVMNMNIMRVSYDY